MASPAAVQTNTARGQQEQPPASALAGRPLVAAAGAFAGGILFAQGADLSTTGAAALLLTGACAWIWTRGRSPALALAALGFALCGACRQAIASRVGPADVSRHAGAYSEVLGTAATDPDIRGGRAVLEIAVRQVARGEAHREASGRLLARLALAPGRQLPEYGDLVWVRGRIERPRSPANPGEFDYSAWLIRRGVRAQVDADHSSSWRVVHAGAEGSDLLARLAATIRRRCRESLARRLPSEESALVAGILLGGRTGLSDGSQDAFLASGTTHLLAASGMNVGLVAVAAGWACSLLRIRGRIQALAVLAVLAAYTLVAGAKPSILRADAMASVLVIGRMLDREPDLPSALAAAALGLLMAEPGQLFDPGFVLSFVTVGALVALAPVGAALLRPIGTLDPPLPHPAPVWIRRAAWAAASVVLVSAAAFAASAPLTAQFFNQASLVAVPANALIAPALLPLMVGGLLLWALDAGAPALAPLAAALLSLLAAYILGAAHALGGLPGASLAVPTPAWPAIVLWYAAGAALLFWWHRRREASAA